jgi:ABC-type dipeptide/oligopeptide/nickel transport system ATPase component
MQQRVMIAMALAGGPKVLIADEPTTALDVTIQLQILDLLADLKRRLGLAVLLITHDLGVAARVADRVAVMYAGRIVESAPSTSLFDHPRHPYTEALLEAIPRVDRTGDRLPTGPRGADSTRGARTLGSAAERPSLACSAMMGSGFPDVG